MNVAFSPSWFFGYDIFLQAIFGLTCLVVALMAYKVYRCCSQQPLRMLSISFLLISLSYLSQAIINAIILFHLRATAMSSVGISVVFLYGVGQYIGVLLLLVGLLTLLYMIFKVEKPILFWLLVLMVLIAIETSSHIFLTAFAFEVLFLAFLSWYFVNNYLKKKSNATLLVASGFVLLLLGSLSFVVSVDHKVFYVIGHLLTFLGYTSITANLVLVLSNAKKKKSS